MQKRVLLVAGTHYLRAQLSVLLMNAGYSIAVAVSEEDCLKRVREEAQDLVLIDMDLSSGNGLDILRKLRRSEFDALLPVILIDIDGGPDEKIEALELGADDYIAGPLRARELLSRIHNITRRMDHVHTLNPLTGLRGNVEIQRVINGRLARGQKFAAIYADLDNLGAYNTACGYERGNAVIRLTAEILAAEIGRHGNPDDFLGHVDADDFVVVTGIDEAEGICRAVIDSFDREVLSLYDPADAQRGGVVLKNRKGEDVFYPVVSLSMAIVSNSAREFENHFQFSGVASELRKKLKMMPGSNYLEDRRKNRQPE